MPLLSVPPNVNFTEGLTADVVRRGVPLWAGKLRRQRIAAARANASHVEGGVVDGRGEGRKIEQIQEVEVSPAREMGVAGASSASPRRLQVFCHISPHRVLFDGFWLFDVVTLDLSSSPERAGSCEAL